MEEISSFNENNSIGERLSLLIKHLNLSDGAFADAAGVDRAQFSKIKRGKLGLAREVAMEICSKFNVSLDWLLAGIGNMFRNTSQFSIVQESDSHYGSGVIPIVDIAAAAGTGYYNADVITTEDTIRLPAHLSNKGIHICIRIKGDSMSPTLLDGGYLIVRHIDKGDWANIRNEHIYVVSDMEGRAFVKRVKNRFEKGFIVLMSDNPDKSQYPNFNLQSNEINTIWHAEWYLSAKMPNIHSGYYKRLQQLEDRLDDFENDLKRKK